MNRDESDENSLNREDTLENRLRDSEDTAISFRQEIEEDIYDNFGRMGLEVWSSIPLITYAGITGLGRLVGFPALGPAWMGFNLFMGGFPMRSPKAIKKVGGDYIKGVTGIGLAFSDLIYKNFIQNYEAVQDLIHHDIVKNLTF